MEQNPELSLARDFIEKTGTSLFLTGKAGTGKTTFLHMLKRECPKRMVVLAPTGIAAINAGGMTIHSFFQLPFAPYIPESAFSTSGNARYSFRFGKEKVRIIRSMDLLVIDEISMVRADLLDEVDSVLRKYRDKGKPFGGVQLLMIGDLQQLPPVVKDDEWQMLKEFYDTPYFFSSMALRQTGYCMIELRTVYRQKDSAFLEILNSVREGRCGRQVLDALNRRYIPDFRPDRKEGWIRLVTHNFQAQRINESELEQLDGPVFRFKATVSGKFPEYSYPTEAGLELKKGAQIMFVKNDTSGGRRYFNGMIGEITGISDSSVEVRVKDTGEEFTLGEEEWTNAKYVLDEETREIREEIEGTFRQIPVRLAWAITIHKSQGLTFEHAVIDAGYSFAHGQAYVALSRCRTLEGLVLGSPLHERAVINDKAVREFTEQARQDEPDPARIISLQRAYFLELLSGLFDFPPIVSALWKYVRTAEGYFAELYPKQIAGYKEALRTFSADAVDVAGKFRVQYTRMAMSSADCTSDKALQERIHSGALYFKEKTEALAKAFSDALPDPDNKELKKRLKDTLKEADGLIYRKTALLGSVVEDGFDTSGYLKKKAMLALEDAPSGLRKKKASASQGGKAEIPSDILHPGLYRRITGWRKARAEAEGVPAYTVLRQQTVLGISNILPQDSETLSGIPYFGKRKTEKYGEEILDMVREYMESPEYRKSGVSR